MEIDPFEAQIFNISTYSFKKDEPTYNKRQIFSFWLSETRGEFHVGSINIHKYAAEGLGMEDIMWSQLNDNKYQWSIKLEGAYVQGNTNKISKNTPELALIPDTGTTYNTISVEAKQKIIEKWTESGIDCDLP